MGIILKALCFGSKVQGEDDHGFTAKGRVLGVAPLLSQDMTKDTITLNSIGIQWGCYWKT